MRWELGCNVSGLLYVIVTHRSTLVYSFACLAFFTYFNLFVVVFFWKNSAASLAKLCPVKKDVN